MRPIWSSRTGVPYLSHHWMRNCALLAGLLGFRCSGRRSERNNHSCLCGRAAQSSQPTSAKTAGLKLCQAYRRQHGCNSLSVIPTNLHGPNGNPDLLTKNCAAVQEGRGRVLNAPFNPVIDQQDRIICVDNAFSGNVARFPANDPSKVEVLSTGGTKAQRRDLLNDYFQHYRATAATNPLL